MSRITLKDLNRVYKEKNDKVITVCGWIKTIRDSKSFGFIEINDGSTFSNIQIVFDDTLDNFNEIKKLNIGSGITVEGKLIITPDMKQAFEIKANKIVIEAGSAPEYPLQKKRHSLEFLREIAHLRPRTNTFNAVFRVRSVAAQAIHRFFGDRGFVYINTPIITASDCEGAGEMFKVTTLDINNPPRNKDNSIDYKKDFFEKPASLTVSGQLEGECFALAFGNIYTFGPTFRAENSNTTRHAAEFWMIEPEIAFADINDDMALASDMIKYVINDVLEKCPEEMNFFNTFIDNGLVERLKGIVEKDFAKITYTEAIDILIKNKENFEYPVHWGADLQTEHERYLTEKVFMKPVFVIDYPKDIKAFYMRLNEDNKTVAAMDLLVPEVGEIIGGSQREERYDMLVNRIKEMNLNVEDYGWYLDLRKYGGVKHAGFGLGFERLVMYVTGIKNIRDVIPFARTVKNCEF